jgi:hypothetical protein
LSAREHNVTGRIGTWPHCKTCGLICLKNAATRVALNAPCPGPRDQKLTGEAADRLFAKLRREGWRE